MASPDPHLAPRSDRAPVIGWLAVALVAVGWVVVVAGALRSALVRDLYDSCGRPANLPSGTGYYCGGVAIALAVVAFGLALSLRQRGLWVHATKVVVAAALLGAAAALVAGWVVVSTLQLC